MQIKGAPNPCVGSLLLHWLRNKSKCQLLQISVFFFQVADCFIFGLSLVGRRPSFLLCLLILIISKKKQQLSGEQEFPRKNFADRARKITLSILQHIHTIKHSFHHNWDQSTKESVFFVLQNMYQQSEAHFMDHLDNFQTIWTLFRSFIFYPYDPAGHFSSHLDVWSKSPILW